MYNSRNIGHDLLNVPMGDMIRDMAFAIAEAQVKLDENSIEVAEMMGGLKTIRDEEGEITFEDSRVFFGRDEVPFSVAKTLYDNSADDTYKGAMLSVMNGEAEVATESSGKLSAKSGVNNDTMVLVPTRLSMLELGFTPSFYQFVDTIIEVKISISYTQEFSSETKVDSNTKSRSNYRSASFNWGSGYRSYRRTSVTTTQVNATYSTKYNYSAEGSSLLRTKLSPVPPPAILEERIRLQMELQREREEAKQQANTPDNS